MTGFYSTIATPAEIADELALTGLFLLGVDADSSRFNHATGTSGTIIGSPTYEADGATFPSGASIDTGIAETSNVTLFCSFDKTGVTRHGVSSFNSESEITTGLFINNFGIRLNGLIAGSRTGFDNQIASVTTSENESAKSAGCAISGFVTWDTGGPAKIWEPREYKEATAIISSSGTRQVLGGTYRIGYSSICPNSTKLHLVAIADYALSEAQQTDFFVWASKHLQTKGVCL